ncbi:MAG: 4Fe-4S cluster-binding domain-containing protein [Nanoarchaeota archaeon]
MAERRLSLQSMEKELQEVSARDFFNHVRVTYLGKSKPNPNLEKILDKVSDQLGLSQDEVWASQRFQLLFRATKPKHLQLLGLDQFVEEAEAAVSAGRVMSLLPYNAVMDDSTIRKYIPSRPEKFRGNWKHSMDPYGIFRAMDRVIAVDGDGNETYLATRKFPYAVLANITEACNIGCDGCYKGSMVRTSLSALAEVYPEYAGIKKQLNLQEQRAEKQAELLVRWLNKNSEVDTIVISGGEPTLFSNYALQKILDQYKQAEHVRVVRMCTSSVFQGMWYRIDDDFAEMLQNFERETDKQFYINAHVTDDHQLSAPEARGAIDKLESVGITIHLQMPLQEGINFRRDDLSWTEDKIRRISKLAYGLGVIPYKMIVDMHSPSHPDLTVPIETVTRVLRTLDEHTHNSDHERWQAYNVLHEQGNIYLTPHPHFTAVKEVDQDAGRVTYFIPIGNAIHTYQEPIINGHNDNPNSFGEIRDTGLNDRISKVRSLFHQLNGDEDTLKKFYEESGIKLPENEPLMV